MLNNCAKSCQVCDWSAKKIKKKVAELTGTEEENKEEEEEPDLTETPYGVAQTAEGKHEAATLKIIENVTKYMDEIVFVDPAYSKIKNDCKNRNKLCAFWAHIGECEKVRI